MTQKLCDRKPIVVVYAILHAGSIGYEVIRQHMLTYALALLLNQSSNFDERNVTCYGYMLVYKSKKCSSNAQPYIIVISLGTVKSDSNLV